MLAPTQSPSFAFFPKQPVMTKTKTSTMVKSVLTSSLPSSTLKRPPPTLVSITPNPAKKRKVVASHRSSSTAIVVKPTPPPPASRSPTAVRDDDTSSEDEIDFTFSRKRSTPIPSDTDPVSFPFASRETWSVLRSPFTCAARAHADERCISSEDVVREVITKYKTYFRNPDDHNDTSFNYHPTDYPFITFEYPNHGASERYPLIIPIDPDHYNPIVELMNAIYAIVSTYFLPNELVPFGTLSHTRLVAAQTAPDYVDHLRNLEKAYNTHHGPLFVDSVNAISALVKEKKARMMHNVLEGWWGVPPMVWKAVVEECYQRCVGPNVKELAKYAPFSNTVYGELNAVFMSDIIHRTGLTEGKMFVDLGCGVGNCLIQTALQAGCIANGIEINPPPAALAKLQVAEFRKRLKMWGLRSGEVNIREGDFCEDEEVKKWMRQADVVLVNNWAFSSTLNATLSLLFLDLPEGSKIVSLKPFRKSDFRITERTASSPEAIFQVEEHEFRKGAVSWTAEGGTYYIHTVDRGPLRAFTERQLVLGASSTGRKRRGGWSD